MYSTEAYSDYGGYAAIQKKLNGYFSLKLKIDKKKHSKYTRQISKHRLLRRPSGLTQHACMPKIELGKYVFVVNTFHVTSIMFKFFFI